MSEIQEPEKLIKQLQIELEVKNQALYDCERQKKTAEALILESQEEIRILQADRNLENKKLEAKIHQLEESNSNLKITYNERIGCLEKELVAKDEELSNLKHELENVIKLADAQQPTVDDNFIENYETLKQQNLELYNEIDELTKICESKENEITTLHDMNLQLKEELVNFKEILECKKDELSEANIINQTLQDKYDCLKAEFDSIKSTPLDDKSRGNSLFAEVDDRRVQLQQNMNQMKTQYLEMKRERAAHLKLISTLRIEKANLLARLDSEVIEQENDNEMVLLSYKHQVRTLTELLEGYKQESKRDNKEEVSMKLFDKMLKSKTDEIEALKEKLSANSFNEIVLSRDLATARKEIRKYQYNVLKLQNEIDQLKIELEELKSSSAPIQEQQSKPQINPENEINDEVKIIDLEDDPNKENIATDKKVQFTDNIIEPRVTDRNKYRRGPKVITAKPVHISSIPQTK